MTDCGSVPPGFGADTWTGPYSGCRPGSSALAGTLWARAAKTGGQSAPSGACGAARDLPGRHHVLREAAAGPSAWIFRTASHETGGRSDRGRLPSPVHAHAPHPELRCHRRLRPAAGLLAHRSPRRPHPHLPALRQLPTPVPPGRPRHGVVSAVPVIRALGLRAMPASLPLPAAGTRPGCASPCVFEPAGPRRRIQLEVSGPSFAARRYSALMRCASSSWSSRMTMRQAASIGVPLSTSSRARAAIRSW